VPATFEVSDLQAWVISYDEKVGAYESRISPMLESLK
jgi:hypothetical protein